MIDKLNFSIMFHWLPQLRWLSFEVCTHLHTWLISIDFSSRHNLLLRTRCNTRNIELLSTNNIFIKFNNTSSSSSTHRHSDKSHLHQIQVIATSRFVCLIITAMLLKLHRNSRFSDTQTRNAFFSVVETKRAKTTQLQKNDIEWKKIPDVNWSNDRDSVIVCVIIFTRTSLLTLIVKNVNELISRLRDVMKQSASQIEKKMTNENIKFELSFDINLEKIQLTNQYQALRLLSQQKKENIQLTIEFENTANEKIFTEKFTTIATSFVSSNEILNLMSFFPIQFHRFSQNLFESLSQQRVMNENFDPFMLALELWCEKCDIFRKQYTSLKKILKMLKFHSTIDRLSNSYASLRRRTKKWLSQLSIRRALLFLNAAKLSSMTKKQKFKKTIHVFRKYLYFFDSFVLFRRILQSQLKSKMHFGFEKFRTHSIEFWQSSAWTTSVRITSEQFARYRNDKLIFPFDWIVYDCVITDCNLQHLNRVIEVDLDYRNGISLSKQRIIKLKIQHAFWNHEILSSSFFSQVFGEHEVMLCHEYFFFTERNVIRRQSNINMHYDNSMLSQSHSKNISLICRFLLNAKGWLQFLSYSFSLREKLKLKIYFRTFYEKQFDVNNSNIKIFSLSYFLFLNDFDLYRNNYRNFMSIYMIFVAFNFNERMRRINVFSLTLEPHESNLNDVLNILSSLHNLNQRFVILDLSQSIRICIFSLVTTENMSQQQTNAKFKSQNANLNCRFCLISNDHRDDLNYDIIQNDKFHHQIMRQKNEMNKLRSIAKKKIFASRWNLFVEQSTLIQLFSALDIIVTRSSDFAHSEYDDLCKQFHHLLLNVILTTATTQTYAIAIRHWFFASEFARLHFSIHHLKNYSLSKHARWIVIVFALLRCWLKNRHFQSYYLIAMQRHLSNYSSDFIATEIIIRIFAIIVRSTSMFMTNTSINKMKLSKVVKKTKSEFQMLLQIVAFATNINSKSRSTISILQSNETENSMMTQFINMTKKYQKFMNDRKKSNVHIAIHYEIFMTEFDLFCNCNVLMNENKHK